MAWNSFESVNAVNDVNDIRSILGLNGNMSIKKENTVYRGYIVYDKEKKHFWRLIK